MDFEHLQEQLTPIVREAGAAIMEVYKQPPEATYKGDGSPVTVADEAAEAIILPALAKIAPGVVVISEENAESHALAAPDMFFLVDPLDGTKEFLRRDGLGSFTVNIGLIRDGVPIFGIVYAPALDRMFCGSEELGAQETVDGATRSISIRPCPAEGAVAVASRSHRDDATNAWLEAHRITQTISTGSSLKFCLVAAGEADVYPRFGPTMEWDTAAGDAVLRAAGGRVVMPDDKPFLYGKTEYRNGPFIARGNA